MATRTDDSNEQVTMTGGTAGTDTGDSRPAALVAVPMERVVELDVRETLRSGREPFARIMAAREEVPAGGALKLRAIFEPAPLYEVMGRKGFEHWTERHADDDWVVWFYRPAGVGEASGPAARDADPGATGGEIAQVGGADGSDEVVVLDVRGLEPPEPMVRTLAALESLPPGATLVQVNVREPRFLLPQLDERGFTYSVKRQSDHLVRLFIRRADAAGVAQAGAAAASAATGPELVADEPVLDEPVLDVRVIPPPRKHPTIFETFDALDPGASFVLVNDHDPRPLRYQFEAERPDAFRWEYLEQGPSVWRVRISRRDVDGPRSCHCSCGAGAH